MPMGPIVELRNDHDDPCPMCRFFIGMFFDSLDAPPLPFHKHCRCYYRPSTTQIVPTRWSWDDAPEDTIKEFVQWVAWLLRQDAIIPKWLRPLISRAKEYNRQREEEDMIEPSPVEDVPEGLQRVQVKLRLAASTNGSPHYRGRLLRAGTIRNAIGKPGHLHIEPTALQSAVERNQFENLACFIDHAQGWNAPSLTSLFGTWRNVRYLAGTEEVEGELHIYENDNTRPLSTTLDTMLQEAAQGLEPPDIGVSIVFYPIFDKNRDGLPRHIIGFHRIESADLVFSPAADGRILEALSTLGGNPVTVETTQETSAVETRDDLASPAGPVLPQPVTAGADDQAPLDEIPQAWLETLAEVAATAVESRIAPLVSSDVIELNQRPPSRITGVRQASRAVEDAVRWAFGQADISTPSPELRDTARLYVLLTGDQHWRGVFNPREALATANVTTLADLAVDAMNKVIVATWDTLATYRWFEEVVVVQPNDGSLQDMKWLQFGGIANLPTVAEGAAYTEATVADSKEADSFTKYGVYVGITRKMIRNSEIARMQAIPKALAIAALRTRESKISGLFTSNSGVGPTLDDDSTALFHANHSNLATTAFSYAAWAAARTECYKQTELNSSKRLGFWPRYWLGPADLYDTALEIFGYGFGPGGKPGTSNNDVNPYGESRPGDPRPIPLAVPSFTDANDWAYIVDPNVQPIIQMSYAQNPGGRVHPTPELFSVVSETAGLMFTNDTMPIKVRDEFAYGVSGYRGIGKRNVA